ncbi:MAG: HIRAN domain-containing protein [Thermomicrobiales bacterium]
MRRRDFVKRVGASLGAAGVLVAAAPVGASTLQAQPRAVEPLFLIDTHIAGTTHVQEIERLAAAIGVGDRLDLVREPTNPFDDLAILVHTRDGEKLGYVPRKDNAVLARLLDAGKQLFVMVESKALHGRWNEILIGIYLVE